MKVQLTDNDGNFLGFVDIVEFDKTSYGKSRPAFYKQKVSSYGLTIKKLAEFIVSRTPYKLYTQNEVFISIVNNCQPNLGDWTKGYELLHDEVCILLAARQNLSPSQ